MNFFLDFEATQFTNEIISIGCVAENGATFYAVVRPTTKKKPTNFIVELTGITREMLKEAQTPDVVFNNFHQWCQRVANNTRNIYYVYGNCDTTFCYTTRRKMKDEKSKSYLKNIIYRTVDFCELINQRYNLPASIGLNRLYNFCSGQDYVQTHNALDDAKMLKYVYNHIFEHSAEEITALVPPNASNAMTYIVNAINEAGEEMAFSSLTEASKYLRKMGGNSSVKTHSTNIKESANSGHKYRGYKWALTPNRPIDRIETPLTNE